MDRHTKEERKRIKEAYEKLNSVMDGGDLRGDDSHEIAAFMRMFMDMVGIGEHEPVNHGTGETHAITFVLHRRRHCQRHLSNVFRPPVRASARSNGRVEHRRGRRR